MRHKVSTFRCMWKKSREIRVEIPGFQGISAGTVGSFMGSGSHTVVRRSLSRFAGGIDAREFLPIHVSDKTIIVIDSEFEPPGIEHLIVGKGRPQIKR